MTAVEWLKEQFLKHQIEIKDFENYLFQQALELEKKQIEYAYIIGIINQPEMEASKQAEQYYNETYKKP